MAEEDSGAASDRRPQTAVPLSYRRLPMADAPAMSARRRRHSVAAVLISAYLLAAALIAVTHAVTMPDWLALHLLVLGAASNAVFVYSRHFAQSLLHVKPGSEGPAHLRLALLNAGAVAALCGMSEHLPWLAVSGAVLVTAAVIAHTASLVSMIRSAKLSGRLSVVARYYVAAGAALAVGGTLGGVLSSGKVASENWQQALRLAHAHLNLLGWLGLVIVGTQFMLWPAVLRTRMSDDAPVIARRVLAITVAGLSVSAAALLLTAVSPSAHWLAAAGMTTYLAGVGYSLLPAVREARAKPPRSAAAVALLAGNVWLLAALAIDVAGLAAGGAKADDLLGRLLVPALGIGTIAQILIGALTFLLPVTVGGGPAGNRRLAEVLEFAWLPRTVLGNIGVLMVLLPLPDGLRPVAWGLVLAGFASFPALALTSLVLARRPVAEPVPSDPGQAKPRRRPGGQDVLALSSIAVVLAMLAAFATGTGSGGKGAGTAATATSGIPVAVTLDEFAVSPSTISVPPGADLVLKVHNNGLMSHDLRLDGARGTRMLAPGEEQAVDFGVVEHDEQAWCTVPGHHEAGMALSIRVAGSDTLAPGMAAMPGMSGTAGGSTPGPQWHAYDPTLRPAADGTEHDVTLRVQQAEMEVAPGVRQQVWTYNGTVPGPLLHGRVGDLFTVHLVNDAPMPHSIDFHASQVDPATAMRAVPPGGDLVYQFRADHAGLWLYHCGTAPMIQHLAMGMYGAVVIDPPNLAPAAVSEVLVQSEYYLGTNGGVPATDRLMSGDPDLVVFNGYADQYRHAPIHVPVGRRIRLWVLDAGPNEPSAFHVVGAQFDTVFKEGAYLLQPGNAADGAAQVIDLQPGEGGFVELTLPQPGTYTFVTHRLADAGRGATGTIVADP